MGWEGVARTSNLAAKIELGRGNFVDQSVSQQKIEIGIREVSQNLLYFCFTIYFNQGSIYGESGMNLG